LRHGGVEKEPKIVILRRCKRLKSGKPLGCCCAKSDTKPMIKKKEMRRDQGEINFQMKIQKGRSVAAELLAIKRAVGGVGACHPG